MENKRYEEDFKIIRAAIDGAKNPIEQLCHFFKTYAKINIIIVALELISNLYHGLALEMYIIKIMCFVYLAYYIFQMYRAEKGNTNQYYQAILYIYGIVVVMIPIILWIARIARLFTSNNEGYQPGKVLEMLTNLQIFSAIILLSVSFLIISFVRDNKLYAMCALTNLTIYLIAFAIDRQLSIGTIMIDYQNLYYYVVLILGYMIMAKCIKEE